MTQHPGGFLCYARFDDNFEKGRLTALRERLRDEVRFHTGDQTFDIFQDQMHIAWGQDWQQRLDESLQAATFLIPILTPSFFNSKHCRAELTKFLAREQQLGRTDLILPVYYLNYAPLNTRARATDPLIEAMRKRQWFDWRDLRFDELDDPPVRRMLAEMGAQITQTMERVQSAPPPKPSPPKPEPAPPSQQNAGNEASNQGAQGNFYGPVTINNSGQGEQKEEPEETRARAAQPRRVPPSLVAAGVTVVLIGLALLVALAGAGSGSGADEPTRMVVVDTATPTATRQPTRTPNPTSQAVDPFNGGRIHSRLGEYELAIEDYDEAIRLDPDYARAYNARGFAYNQLGEYERAIEDYDEAIRLDPEYVIAYNNRGFAYNQLGEYERAIENLDEAIRFDPDYDFAHYNRGVAYANLGQHQRAIEDYGKAIRFNPDLAYAHYNRGFSHKLLGNTTQAIADFEHVLTLDSANDGWRADAERELRELGAR